MKRLIAAALILAALGWWMSPPRERARPPGVLVRDVPVQTDIANATPFEHGEFRITPLAGFRAQARVLSRENYRFDPGAALSPIDLALGWGAMSDTTVLDQLDLRQSSRWFTYRWRGAEPPIPQEQILVSASNMHMIPANPGIAHALERIRTGDVVTLSGKLVDVVRADGWHWRSSLSREDTGDGACELVWVEAVTVQ